MAAGGHVKSRRCHPGSLDWLRKTFSDGENGGELYVSIRKAGC